MMIKTFASILQFFLCVQTGISFCQKALPSASGIALSLSLSLSLLLFSSLLPKTGPIFSFNHGQDYTFSIYNSFLPDYKHAPIVISTLFEQQSDDGSTDVMRKLIQIPRVSICCKGHPSKISIGCAYSERTYPLICIVPGSLERNRTRQPLDEVRAKQLQM